MFDAGGGDDVVVVVAVASVAVAVGVGVAGVVAEAVADVVADVADIAAAAAVDIDEVVLVAAAVVVVVVVVVVVLAKASGGSAKRGAEAEEAALESTHGHCWTQSLKQRRWTKPGAQRRTLGDWAWLLKSCCWTSCERFCERKGPCHYRWIRVGA